MLNAKRNKKNVLRVIRNKKLKEMFRKENFLTDQEENILFEAKELLNNILFSRNLTGSFGRCSNKFRTILTSNF